VIDDDVGSGGEVLTSEFLLELTLEICWLLQQMSVFLWLKCSSFELEGRKV